VAVELDQVFLVAPGEALVRVAEREQVVLAVPVDEAADRGAAVQVSVKAPVAAPVPVGHHNVVAFRHSLTMKSG
jgi:hypothetical protein